MTPEPSKRLLGELQDNVIRFDAIAAGNQTADTEVIAGDPTVAFPFSGTAVQA